MQPDTFRRSSRPLQARALVLLLALTATACAGEVGKYRNAAVSTKGAPAESAAAPAAGADQSARAPGVAPADLTGAAAPAGAGTGSSATTGASSITTASGPAARVGRQATGASGQPASAAGRDTAVATGPGTPSIAAAGGTGSGPASTAPSGDGGAGTTAPGPAPVPGGGTTTGVTKDTITLGVFYPKTGAYTGIARNAPAVAQAAFDEAGPINGRRVILKFYDDGTANASTIQVEEKRAKDEVFSLMSIVSESNVVLAPLANQHKVPIIVGNIDQKVALPLTYAFPIYAYWARMASILPSFIKNSLGAGSKKIGIVYEGTSTAIDAKNAFKDKAKDLGLNVVFEQPIALNQSTCANEVANLQSHGVELVYMMNGPLGAICMLRDAKALGYRPTWTGVGTSWSFNVVAQASGGGADGIRTISTTTTLDTPAGRHFSELMRQHAPNSGADTDDIMLIFYAVMKSAIEGLRRAGPDLTREGLVQTWETKMNGYDSGYTPPPTYGPGNRTGPVMVGVSACCTNGQWTAAQSGWRATF